MIELSASCLLVALSVGVWLATRSSAVSRWNLVLVTFDTTRANHIGHHGYDRGRTPAFDALAHDGVAYLRCYTPAPVTLPAHCSLMTGLTPLRHGVHDNGSDALASEVETLAEILDRHGYATAAFVGAFVLDRQFGLAQGFRQYDDDMTGGKKADQFCYAERNAQLVTDAALRWLSEPHDEPTFIWIHYFDPHNPYEAPGFDPTFSSLTDYDAEISFADSQLKRVVDFFNEESGRPTLFVVAADHGEGLGEHGEPTHGMFAYDTTLHVPLVVRFPSGAHEAKRINTPVSLVDIAPSVLQWLGLPLPPDVDGRSLPLTDDTSQVVDDRQRGIYFENYFVFSNYGWSPLVGAIWNDFKFIQAPRPELYNLTDDPNEMTQLIEAQNQKANQFQARFDSFVANLRARGSYAAKSVELTTSGISSLESLGYVGSRGDVDAPPPDDVTGAPDPKDMVDVLAKIHSATFAMEQKSTREAVDLLTQVASSDDPGNPRAVRMLSALIAESPQERPRILACLEQARSLDRRAMDVHSMAMMGMGFLADEQYQAAIETFHEVTRRAPLEAAAYRYLGDAHGQLGQFTEATRHYQRAIELAARLNEPPEWLEHVRQQLDNASRHENKSD